MTKRRFGSILSVDTLEDELYRVRRQEQYITFVGLYAPLEDAVAILRQEAQEITSEHCTILACALHEVQQVVQGSIAVLELPDMALGSRPYPTLLRLYALHRTIGEAQVLVRNAHGLCLVGRLGQDFTGVYEHLKSYLSTIIRSRRDVLALLGVEAVQEMLIQTHIARQA